MGELYLAVLACKLPKSSHSPTKPSREPTLVVSNSGVSCGVALGSTYLRTAVPSSPQDSFRCWRVPSAFSVCTVSVLAGSDEEPLGATSVPVMRLRQSAGQTLDDWFSVGEGTDGLPAAQLHLLMHFRPPLKRGQVVSSHQDSTIPAEEEPLAVPTSFECRYNELVELQCRQSGLGAPEEPMPAIASTSKLIAIASQEFPGPIINLGIDNKRIDRGSKQQEEDLILAELIDRLAECCTSFDDRCVELRMSDGETPVTSNNDACMHLLVQRAAMEREIQEMEAHFAMLGTSRRSRLEASEVSQAACEDAREDLARLESEVASATGELRSAQREATEHLVARNRLHCELGLCAEAFNTELVAQGRTSERLKAERANLRELAVSLGSELQASVFEIDELHSRSLRTRSEAASLEDERSFLGRARELSVGDSLLQEAASCCRVLLPGYPYAPEHCIPQSLAEYPSDMVGKGESSRGPN